MSERDKQRTLLAQNLHAKLDTTQRTALYFLSKRMGNNELQDILYDFCIAKGVVTPDHEVIKDVIDFWY